MGEAEADAWAVKQWSKRDLEERQQTKQLLQAQVEQLESESQKQKDELTQLKKDLKAKDREIKEQHEEWAKLLVQKQQLEATIEESKRMAEEGDKSRQMLEFDAAQLRESSKAKDQMIREQQEEGKRHLIEKQRFEAIVKETQMKLERMTEERDDATNQKRALSAFKVMNRMQTLRKEANLRGEELKNLPSLIEQDNEIKLMLDEYGWIAPYANLLRGDLEWIAIEAEYGQGYGSPYFQEPWAKAEERIENLI